MSLFLNTAAKIKELAAKHSSVMVCYSGGKESVCCLDLCCRAFSTVVGLHLYPLPGFPWTAERVAWAESHFKIKVLLYQDPNTLNNMRAGIYTFPQRALRGTPTLRNNDVYRLAAREHGIKLIVTGSRKGDGMNTAGTLRQRAKAGEFVYPLFDWRQADVLAYMAHRKLPLPESDGRRSSGFDLTALNLLWMADKRPDCFAVYERYFPFVRAVVKRREWYGIGA